MTSSSSLEKEKSKLVHEKCQQILTKLLKDEDNKYCVDCDGKSPRWASWNIGIFLCIRCAGIHRNLGVHISKVKSVNLDTWTPQQVACIEQMGNSRARAVYEAKLPDTFQRPQSDSSLEKFIRAKYEAKKYIAREWVEPPMPKPTWDIIIEKQLRAKKEKKVSIGKINFPVSKISSVKSRSISPKPLPEAPSSKLSSNKIDQPNKIPVKPSENGAVFQDLLGLDTTAETNKSIDPFGDFLSAPMAAKVDTIHLKTNSDEISEETSFFNQKLPNSSVVEKLTKDSILALYSTKPNHTQQPSFGAMQGLNGSPAQGNPNLYCVQQGFSGYPQNAQMFPQLPNINSTVPGMVPIQAYNQGIAPPTALNQMIPVVPVGFQLSAANPFAQMQSQMANMTMTGMKPGQTTLNNQNMTSTAANYLHGQNNSLPINMWQ